MKVLIGKRAGRLAQGVWRAAGMLLAVAVLTLGLVPQRASASPASDCQYNPCYIQSITNKACMTIQGASQADDARAILWGCIGVANQKFTIQQSPYSGWYRIKPAHSDHQCLTAFVAEFTSDLGQWTCSDFDFSQLWWLGGGGGGKWTLQDASSYQCAQNHGYGVPVIRVTCNNSNLQKWYIFH